MASSQHPSFSTRRLTPPDRTASRGAVSPVPSIAPARTNTSTQARCRPATRPPERRAPVRALFSSAARVPWPKDPTPIVYPITLFPLIKEPLLRAVGLCASRFLVLELAHQFERGRRKRQFLDPLRHGTGWCGLWSWLFLPEPQTEETAFSTPSRRALAPMP